MLETAFNRGVRGKLPPGVHTQSMTHASLVTPGTPDYYMDWYLDLWVEFKVLGPDDRLPALMPEKALPTKDQQLWLNRRFKAGGNAVVLVGTKIRGRIMGMALTDPAMWCERHPRSWYEPRLCSAADLAAYLSHRLGDPNAGHAQDHRVLDP